MKLFSCGDVVPGCSATFQASDDAGILGLVATHAASAHGVTVVSDDLVAAVRSNIRAA